MFGLALLVTAALVAGLWWQHGLVLHQVTAAEDTGIQVMDCETFAGNKMRCVNANVG